MTISQILGRNIKKIRTASGMTMDNLARLIHKSKLFGFEIPNGRV